MNSITTRTIAALGATGALVAGGAATANANGDVETPQRSEVQELVHDAVEDGVVTVEEEDAIKQAIEEHSGLEFESLDQAVPQG